MGLIPEGDIIKTDFAGGRRKNFWNKKKCCSLFHTWWKFYFETTEYMLGIQCFTESVEVGRKNCHKYLYFYQSCQKFVL